MIHLFRTHAERLGAAQLVRDQQRRIDIAEQCSPAKSARLRIRAWEKLHALRLPPDPAHPILHIVAEGTGLTLQDMLEEQRVRASPR